MISFIKRNILFIIMVLALVLIGFAISSLDISDNNDSNSKIKETQSGKLLMGTAKCAKELISLKEIYLDKMEELSFVIKKRLKSKDQTSAGLVQIGVLVKDYKNLEQNYIQLGKEILKLDSLVDSSIEELKASNDSITIRAIIKNYKSLNKEYNEFNNLVDRKRITLEKLILKIKKKNRIEKEIDKFYSSTTVAEGLNNFIELVKVINKQDEKQQYTKNAIFNDFLAKLIISFYHNRLNLKAKIEVKTFAELKIINYADFLSLFNNKLEKFKINDKVVLKTKDEYLRNIDLNKFFIESKVSARIKAHYKKTFISFFKKINKVGNIKPKELIVLCFWLNIYDKQGIDYNVLLFKPEDFFIAVNKYIKDEYKNNISDYNQGKVKELDPKLLRIIKLCILDTNELGIKKIKKKELDSKNKKIKKSTADKKADKVDKDPDIENAMDDDSSSDDDDSDDDDDADDFDDF